MGELSLRAKLKTRTASLHQQAEAALSIDKPIETVEGLSAFLRCMHATHRRFWHPCNRASQMAALPSNSDAMLEALALDLGLARPVADQQLSHSAGTPPSDDYCWGIGYVFEGSAMGAKVLCRRLQKADIKSSVYLKCVASQAHVRWPKFIAALELKPQDETMVIAGAIAAFEHIINEAKAGMQQAS